MFPGARNLSLAALVAVALAIGLAGAAAQGLDPSSVTEEIADGGSVQIEKTVHTPTIPPNADICFLADTTGSMGPHLANVQAGIGTIIAGVLAESPNAQFCAAQYEDVGDPFTFSLDQDLTSNTTDVQNAVNSWSAIGGSDIPEDQLHALTEMATTPTWRPDPAVSILVWFGDAPGHDPASGGESLASTITALQNAGIIVIALDNAALDSTGQATAITDATNGLLTTDVTDVTSAIIAALEDVEIPITVAMTSDCSGVVTTAFEPASQVVNAGEDAVFDETISVTAGPADQGKTYECDDWATINGEKMTDATGAVILEHKTITVPDTTAPSAPACTESTNPSGKNVPKSGANAGNSGQNPDGFYLLRGATDNVDPNPMIILVDEGKDAIPGTADDTTFGPFANGTKIKYIEANGATPSQTPGPGDVDWQIKGNGDFGIYAVDASGNQSALVECHVAPPPKR
jgi:hypothetical protein